MRGRRDAVIAGDVVLESSLAKIPRLKTFQSGFRDLIKSTRFGNFSQSSGSHHAPRVALTCLRIQPVIVISDIAQFQRPGIVLTRDVFREHVRTSTEVCICERRVRFVAFDANTASKH